jgi:hypothetical protein
MRVFLIFLLLLSISQIEANAINYGDARVFDANFYLHNHPDLMRAGLLTNTQALVHWKNNGIFEGRQATTNFHSVQYLRKYPDLLQTYGKTGYLSAIQHYLTLGNPIENRTGIILSDGTENLRWTIQRDNILYVSASTRTSGVVDAIKYKEKEYINSFDHGRQLQLAFTNGSLECYNPTQAGSSTDGIGELSSSKIVNFINKPFQDSPTFSSSSFPAFWFPAGLNPPPVGCPQGTINKVSVFTGSQFDYNVSILKETENDFYKLSYKFKFTIAEDYLNGVQIESPTGYLNADFNNFFTYDPSINQFNSVPLPGLNGIQYPLPVMICTSNQVHCMSAVPISYPNFGNMTNIRYAAYSYNFNTVSTTNKWSVVWKTFYRHPIGTLLEFETIVCIGTAQENKNCLNSLFN